MANLTGSEEATLPTMQAAHYLVDGVWTTAIHRDTVDPDQPLVVIGLGSSTPGVVPLHGRRVFSPYAARKRGGP